MLLRDKLLKNNNYLSVEPRQTEVSEIFGEKVIAYWQYHISVSWFLKSKFIKTFIETFTFIMYTVRKFKTCFIIKTWLILYIKYVKFNLPAVKFDILALNDRPDFQWVVEIYYHLIDVRISATSLFLNCFLLLI